MANAEKNQPEDQRLVQARRLGRLKEECSRLGLTATNASYSATAHQYSRMFVFPKYKLMYCAVPKASCTSWKRLLAVLNDFVDDADDLKRPHMFALSNFLSLAKLSSVEREKALMTYTKFFFVRNPYSRLLSAYREKFRHGHDAMQKIVKDWFRRNKPKEQEYQKGNVTFDMFVTYYLDSIHVHKNVHWEDMHKLCQPCAINYDFIGYYETLKSDSDYLFDLIHAPDSVRFPDPQKLPTHSSSDDNLREYYSQISDKKLKLLSMTPGLNVDLELFNYSMPDIIRRN